jgi:hypothetical protein
MNITSYNIIDLRDDGRPSIFSPVYRVTFEDKNWFKTSLIEMLEKNKEFTNLDEDEKIFIKDALIGDILDPNTVFDLFEYNVINRRTFKYINDTHEVIISNTTNKTDCIHRFTINSIHVTNEDCGYTIELSPIEQSGYYIELSPIKQSGYKLTSFRKYTVNHLFR